mmetsp:Transcript_109041/g.188840  ORF Transcript_109041/g.188840 Transcript_109041/m.188840 type:complete len:338 (+) Transcript_109041:534-1547(+)
MEANGAAGWSLPLIEPRVPHDVAAPVAQVEGSKVLTILHGHQVVPKEQQLAVMAVVLMSVFVRRDLQSIPLVHHKVAAEVVHVDRIMRAVVLRELLPDDLQRFDLIVLDLPIVLASLALVVVPVLHPRHRALVQDEGHAVLCCKQHPHLRQLCFHPLPAGLRPKHKVVILVHKGQERVQVGPLQDVDGLTGALAIKNRVVDVQDKQPLALPRRVDAVDLRLLNLLLDLVDVQRIVRNVSVIVWVLFVPFVVDRELRLHNHHRDLILWGAHHHELLVLPQAQLAELGIIFHDLPLCKAHNLLPLRVHICQCLQRELDIQDGATCSVDDREHAVPMLAH